MKPIAAARLKAFLAEHLGTPPRRLEVHRLLGDASDRTYYRLLLDEEKTLVLAHYIGSFTLEHHPYYTMDQLLRKLSLDTPRILGCRQEEGMLLLEDLGDKTLYHLFPSLEREERESIYRRVIDILITLQTEGTKHLTPRHQAYHLAFDEEKLMEELNFFYQHYLIGLLKREIPPEDESLIRRWFTRLSSELAALPRVLCHRDYHSRNLMLKGGKIYLIDFQDARMGPYSYDLVSLLRDSYIELEEGTVEELIHYYLAHHPHFKPRRDGERFLDEFDLMALQRNIKAIGTFAYQAVAKGNTFYRQFIPPTLRYIHRNLINREEWRDIRSLLSRYMEV
ncbi:MAG: aminoglycoside phosphotransferase family protein [Acidobacteriota bacterium]